LLQFFLFLYDFSHSFSGKKKEQISSQWGLADEIQKNIMTKSLSPTIRTIYQRTAFQLSSDNNIRLSLDTKLTFLKEIAPNDIVNDWCRFGKFPAENELQFPLGVMEIKLNKEAPPPPWIIDLVKSGYLVCSFTYFYFCTIVRFMEIVFFPFWSSLHLTR
jgi:SPX domain protein involved in polyphosphate accumulation